MKINKFFLEKSKEGRAYGVALGENWRRFYVWDSKLIDYFSRLQLPAEVDVEIDSRGKFKKIVGLKNDGAQAQEQSQDQTKEGQRALEIRRMSILRSAVIWTANDGDVAALDACLKAFEHYVETGQLVFPESAEKKEDVPF